MRRILALALIATLTACGGGNESTPAPAAVSPAPVPCGQSAECTARVMQGDHIATCTESVAYGAVWSTWDSATPRKGTCEQTAN